MEARLLDSRLTKARESICKVGERLQFTVRRPTQLEHTERRHRFGGDDMLVAFDTIKNCVVGWNLLESDIEHGGASDAVPFDPNLYRQWVADRTDIWLPIWEHVLEKLDEYQRRAGDLQGN